MKKLNNQIIIGVDHGYGNIKTANHCFMTGILGYDSEPLFTGDKFTKEEIVEWISKYKHGNINDLDYRKEIIDTFVNSVFVYEDKLVLTYNYKDGSETLTLQQIESILSSNLTSMCPPNETHTIRCGFFVW